MSAGSQRAPAPLVMKFGGTSVGDPRAVQQVVQITAEARQDYANIVIVASAVSGMTNRLLASAVEAASGNASTVHQNISDMRRRHHEIAEATIQNLARRTQVKQEIDHLINSFSSLCQAIGVLGEATPRALDAVAGIGERMSIRLIAAALESAGIAAQYVEATQLIVSDGTFQAARPDFAATRRRTQHMLSPLLEGGVVPVVTGFLAATPDGIPTTLGRGGSDYSAAILAVALDAQDVWIWTDVDGVMSADPRLVPAARTIEELTFREVAELAYFGARVLHPKTIRPIVEAGIGLRVCNTFNPDHPGTRIRANGNHITGVVKAVTAIQGERLVTIEGRGMLGVPGVAARAFAAVAETGTSVILISQASSEQSICFAIPSQATTTVIAALEHAFAAELAVRDIDRIWATEETVIVTVVGAGMRDTPGVAGKIFGALGHQQVNVIAIAQGSSEAAISLVVGTADTEAAVRAIHEVILESD